MRSWKIVKAPFVSCLFDLVNYLTPTLRLSFHATNPCQQITGISIICTISGPLLDINSVSSLCVVVCRFRSSV